VTLEHTPILDAVIRRIVLATKLHGKRTTLAKFLKVPNSRVSEWLNHAVTPGAEITLRLIQWVELEEAKQAKKSRHDARTPRRQKTRSTQSNYAKRKSKTGPPRK
jgi:hypothetical protein